MHINSYVLNDFKRLNTLVNNNKAFNIDVGNAFHIDAPPRQSTGHLQRILGGTFPPPDTARLYATDDCIIDGMEEGLSKKEAKQKAKTTLGQYFLDPDTYDYKAIDTYNIGIALSEYVLQQSIRPHLKIEVKISEQDYQRFKEKKQQNPYF